MPARVMLLVLTVGLFIAIWSGDRGRVGKTPARQAVAHQPAGSGSELAGEEPRYPTARRHVRTNPRPASRRRPQRNAAHTTPLTPRPKPAVSLLPGVEQGHGVVNSRPDAHARSVGNSLREFLALAERMLHIASAAARSATASSSEVSVRRIPLPGGLTPGEYRVVRSDGEVMRLRLTAEELTRRGLPRPKTATDFRALHDGRMRWYFIRIAPGGTRGTIPGILQSRPMTVRSEGPEKMRIDAARANSQGSQVAAPVVARKPMRRPVVAVRPYSRRSQSVASSLGVAWLEVWNARVWSAQQAVMQLPMRAGRLWWSAVRANLNRWSKRWMPPARTAGKKHPLRD